MQRWHMRCGAREDLLIQSPKSDGQCAPRSGVALISAPWFPELLMAPAVPLAILWVRNSCKVHDGESMGTSAFYQSTVCVAWSASRTSLAVSCFPGLDYAGEPEEAVSVQDFDSGGHVPWAWGVEDGRDSEYEREEGDREGSSRASEECRGLVSEQRRR